MSATVEGTLERGRAFIETFSSACREPQWLLERRLAAWEVFEKTPMPDPQKDEDWRRFSFTGFDLARQPLGAAPAYSIGAVPEGATVLPLVHAARSRGDLVRDLLATGAIPAARGKFEALSAALFHCGTFVHLPEGVVVAEPIVLRGNAEAAGEVGFHHRHLIILEPRASATILAIDESAGAPGFRNVAVEIYLREGAQLRYATVQTLGAGVWSFETRRALVGRDASVEWVSCDLGGKTVRTVSESHLGEQGGRAEARSMIFAAGRQHVDVSVRMIHVARHTTSDMVVRAALEDEARSVYRGHVDIKRGAKGTDSQQKEAVLLLSPEARSDAIPSLFIDENDVKAGHGATAGRVDARQVFYLMSRGLERKTAEKLIIEGFFAPLLERISVEPLRDELLRRIDEKMGMAVRKGAI